MIAPCIMPPVRPETGLVKRRLAGTRLAQRVPVCVVGVASSFAKLAGKRDRHDGRFASVRRLASKRRKAGIWLPTFQTGFL